MGAFSKMNICILIHLLLNNISYGQCIDEWRYGFFEIENFIDSNGDTLNQSDSRGYHQGMHVYFEYEKITNTKWGAYTKGRYLDGKPIGDWKEHHLNGSYAVGKFNSGEECRTINGKFDCKKQGIYKKIGLWKCYNVFGKLIGEVYFDSIKSMDQLKNSIDEPYRSLYLTHIKDTIEIIPVNKIDDYNKSNIISLKPLSLNEVIGKYGTSYHMSYWSVVSRWSDKGPISHIEKEVTYRELGFTFRFHSDDTLKYYIISNKAKCKVYPNIILGKTTVSDLFKSLGESEIDENYDNSRKYTYFKYGDLLFGVKALTLFGNVPFKSRLKKKVIKRIKIIY